jgi:hypothetical protein
LPDSWQTRTGRNSRRQHRQNDRLDPLFPEAKLVGLEQAIVDAGRSRWVTTSKHRLDAAALPRCIQEQLLRRCLLNQWLALTPPELVKAHLKLDPQTLALHKEKVPVVPA